jgi:NodT family efflux transporter outer membrane factor (OMF) lipoprotein
MIRTFAKGFWGASLAGLLLTGCEMAPHYAAPAVAKPLAYKEDPAWTAAQPADAAPRGAWWRVFASPELDALEAKVTSANQDLKAATARFDEARALARQAQAALYPTVDAVGTGGVHRLSQDVANPLPNRRFDDYALSLDLNYEIDVWGRVRDLARAGRARAQASAADLATVDLSLHAELAIDYFTLRGLDAQQAVLEQTVAAYAKALDLTQSRFKGGYAAEADVASAQASLELARTQSAETRLNRARLEHAIAVLVGEPASSFALPPVTLAMAPPAVAPALPGALLQRRPDIAAAERRVAAANADIGAAKAAFFPQFTLAGVLGTEATAAGRLFASPAETWSLGPTGALNLFDGGRRRALDAQARAAYEEAAAAYRQTVIGAYGQVEDNLAALRLLADEDRSQGAAVEASARARAQAERRYNGGYAAYYEVITAQNIELSARLQQAQIQARRMAADVSLIKALGGGWTATPAG